MLTSEWIWICLKLNRVNALRFMENYKTFYSNYSAEFFDAPEFSFCLQVLDSFLEFFMIFHLPCVNLKVQWQFILELL